MDTPQLTPALLLDGLAALTRPDVDAVLGPATDGGYWSVGLKRPGRRGSGVRRRPDERAARPGPPSASGCATLGLRVHEQPALTDIDTFEDARAVAELAPRTLFARVLASERPARVAA